LRLSFVVGHGSLVPLAAERELILEVELLPFVHSKVSGRLRFDSFKTLPPGGASALQLLEIIAMNPFEDDGLMTLGFSC
jgi:hypothetical protein